MTDDALVFARIAEHLDAVRDFKGTKGRPGSSALLRIIDQNEFGVSNRRVNAKRAKHI